MKKNETKFVLRTEFEKMRNDFPILLETLNSGKSIQIIFKVNSGKSYLNHSSTLLNHIQGELYSDPRLQALVQKLGK